MAELSADAQAIVDRLKREGDLSRNSGTNSIRSVKIELSKFEDIFKSISTNIAAQAEILKVQTNLSKEAAEKAETKEQFEEVEPQTKTDRDEKSGPLVTERESKVIDSIGNSIKSALSLKNLALAGAGIFVGYNLLKGFIDEKTGGGFTEFEKNIGPFAKSLPIIGKVLTDFPGTLAEMKTSIQTMTTSVTDFVTKLGETLEKFTTIKGILGVVVDNLGLITIAILGLKAYILKLQVDMLKQIKNPGAGVPGAPGAPDAPDKTKPDGGKKGGSKLGGLARGAAKGILRFGGPVGALASIGMMAYEALEEKKELEDFEAKEARKEKLTQEESVRYNDLSEANQNAGMDPESEMFKNLGPKKTKPPAAVDTTPATDPEAHLVQNRNTISSVGGGRGFIVEKPGERAAYMQGRADRSASLAEIDRKSVDITESMSTDNANRRNGLNTVSGNGSGGGSPVIINAPVNAPSSVNVTNGGSSVSQLSISGGGGAGIGPSMLPYGLTNAYN